MTNEVVKNGTYEVVAIKQHPQYGQTLHEVELHSEGNPGLSLFLKTESGAKLYLVNGDQFDVSISRKAPPSLDS